MKKILLLIWFVSVSMTSFSLDSDTSRMVERVYLSTDKDVYIAGDNIWCSAFCLDALSDSTAFSSLSSVAYVELSSIDGVAQTAKISLNGGRGAGMIALRPDLPTGNYRIIAYTSLNKNEKGYIPEGKVVTIYNTLSSERVSGNVVPETSESFAEDILVRNMGSSASVLLPEGDVRSSGVYPIVINNPESEKVSLSVSIYKEDTLSALKPYFITDYFLSDTYLNHGEVIDSLLPDYEGELIRVQVREPKVGLIENLIFEFGGPGANVRGHKIGIKGLLPGTKLFCSVLGSQNRTFVSPIPISGKVGISCDDIYGSQKMFFQTISGDSLINYRVIVEDPFLRLSARDLPKLQMNSKLKEKLARRGLNMQIERRFSNDSLYEGYHLRNMDFLEGGVKYHLDDYTRFPTMREVITEFIKELSRRTKNGKEYIRVSIRDTYDTYTLTNGSTLFLVDGIPVFDHEKILDYDPLLIKDITVYRDRYLIGNDIYDGVVTIDTYNNDAAGLVISDGISVVQFEGVLIPRAFTGSKIRGAEDYPDYRQTIYWNPIVEVLSGESFNIECVTPMYAGDFVLVAEGVTESGKPVCYKSSFKVR